MRTVLWSRTLDDFRTSRGNSDIHRDIKPGNVMVNSRGAVKVMDFGLAKLISQSDEIQTEAETEKLISTPGLIMGTVPYMSPEQVRGEQLDVRAAGVMR